MELELEILHLPYSKTKKHQNLKVRDLRRRRASTKSRDLLMVWSRDKCKTLYLDFCNAYGYLTWKNYNLRWGDPNLKVTWPFDHVVNWQMKKSYICTSAASMSTKLGRVVTYGQKTPSTKSGDFLITWSCGKWKKLISALPRYLWQQTWQSGNLR